MDCVLIQNNKAHEIWRKTTKASLEGKYTSSILSAVVETQPDSVQQGYVWDGVSFSAPPPPPPNETLTEMALRESRRKDILSTCAVIVRARNISTWNAMTASQKVDATLAEANVWKNIREFIDDKV